MGGGQSRRADGKRRMTVHPAHPRQFNDDGLSDYKHEQSDHFQDAPPGKPRDASRDGSQSQAPRQSQGPSRGGSQSLSPSQDVRQGRDSQEHSPSPADLLADDF
jgi:hypothetical protein